MIKYELTTEFKIHLGKKLFRIKALVDFADVKAGEYGGYIENERNLSHEGNAWVYGDAQVSGDAWVSGDADYALIKGFGTSFRTSTFFKSKDENVKVSCGCFLGTIDEFREQVKKTRTGKIADEYLKIADLMEMHFKD